MRQAIAVVALVLLAATGYASDFINQFSFRTVEGKIVEYKAGGGSAMVVNIGAHW